MSRYIDLKQRSLDKTPGMKHLYHSALCPVFCEKELVMINSTHNHPAIEIKHLSKSYRKRRGEVVHAVQDLSLSIPTGQILGFLGANGAGKTTTIKMICGLVIPSSGTIEVNGYNLARQHSIVMRQIGAVLEGTRNVYWRLTPWQNLLYFGRLKGYWGKDLQIRSEQLLRELDLWDRRHDPIRMFSRGMQQKVAIACALIADPPIILLDEPTLGLDIQAARTVKEQINILARKQGKTIILTTHQLDLAQELCDQVAIMRKGQLLTNQPLTELLHHFQQEYYQIRVKGTIPDSQQKSLFSTLKIQVENGETTLVTAITDQKELQDLLGLIYSLGLPLLSVERCEPDLEEVFIRLMEEQRQTLPVASKELMRSEA